MKVIRKEDIPTIIVPCSKCGSEVEIDITDIVKRSDVPYQQFISIREYSKGFLCPICDRITYVTQNNINIISAHL